MSINLDQYKNIFSTIPPSLDELNDVILDYELNLQELNSWWGTLKDIFDGKLHLSDLCDDVVIALKSQPFWYDHGDYNEMLNECGDYFNYFQEALTNLTLYKEETFGDFCRHCGHVFAA